MYYNISVCLPLLLLVLTATSVLAMKKAVDVAEENWKWLLADEWMVAFVAPWCPACRRMHEAWQEFSDFSENKGFTVAKVDITKNPGLSGRFMVTALPTIYHVSDGVFRQYRGARDLDSLISFIEQKKWEHIKPISKWKHPSSLQMTIVAKFFEWSYHIRAIHTYLVDQGIPYWASYCLFALATVIIGAVLGLMIVACLDYVFPGRPQEYQQAPEVTEREGSDLEEEEPSQGTTKIDRGDIKDKPDNKTNKKKSKKID